MLKLARLSLSFPTASAVRSSVRARTQSHLGIPEKLLRREPDGV
jgi:hypothetical protein